MSGFVLVVAAAIAGQGKTETSAGTVTKVDATDPAAIVIEVDVRSASDPRAKRFMVAPTAKVRIDGKPGSATAIRAGDDVSLIFTSAGIDADSHPVKSITARTKAGAAAAKEKEAARERQMEANRKAADAKRDADRQKILDKAYRPDRRYDKFTDSVVISSKPQRLSEHVTLMLSYRFDGDSLTPSASLAGISEANEFADRVAVTVIADDSRFTLEADIGRDVAIGGKLVSMAAFNLKPEQAKAIATSRRFSVRLNGSDAESDSVCHDVFVRVFRAAEQEIADRKAGKFAKP